MMNEGFPRLVLTKIMVTGAKSRLRRGTFAMGNR